MFEQDALVALQVEVRLRGDADGLTRLKLPDHWGTARELWTLLRDFTVEGATVADDADPSIRRLTAAPDAPLVVRYRVVSGFDRDPTAEDGQPFLPIIRPTWFDVFGEALFAYPEGREDDPATFTWRDAPPAFRFASDLEHLAGARPGVVGDVLESIVIGGPDLDTRAHGQVRVAILGDYDFGHDAFFDLSLAVIAAQREFWGDEDAPFLITLAPQKKIDGSMTYGGTGRSDAFTLTVAENASIADLRHLLAHEYFHTWNARQLGGQADGPAEGAGKWFAEGFTEFFTWRLLLRAGLYSLEDFVTAWNGALLEYWTSPVRDEPNARIVADYWNDHAVSRLPYRRGPLLAAIWEQRLRQATAGARDLDDVLKAMRAKVKASPVKLAPDAAGVFPPVYRELGGPDLAADLARFVDQGVAIELPADVFGPCVRVVDSVRREFERGWDVDATAAAGRVVTGLREGSAAWRAGLRDGMAIVEREAGVLGDSTVPYVLRVRDGERERVIRFKPEGERELPLQQLELAPDLTPERRAACARELSGA
ncbi:Predicted metalloprotease, contains C-terminal PDZ domain [Nannocystis exedens]|uniref:Predicted metalloprotease, contains C-terminal PDZ domain n=1 Tax=Nannocystis exedens TaxID=54 RepID=A0A1I2AAJ7_9BACT|nr:M61 glycyl aminopeptidase [Nannocystis exedens]SFE40608.1 Predicted metalloprotease, contains C-terminal PDZ domain [Nannocystis exedens]